MDLEERISEEHLNGLEENRKRRQENGIDDNAATIEDYAVVALPSILYLGRIGIKEQKDIAQEFGLPENIFTDVDTTLGSLIGAVQYASFAYVGKALPWLPEGFVDSNFDAWVMYGAGVLSVNAVRFGWSRLTGKPTPSVTPISIGLNLGTKASKQVYRFLPEPAKKKLGEMKNWGVEKFYSLEEGIEALEQRVIQDCYSAFEDLWESNRQTVMLELGAYEDNN